MNRLLLIGDTSAKYHPMSNIYTLGDLLNGFDPVYTDDYDYFLKLHNFCLCVSYIDSWNRPLSNGQSASLKEYLYGGGSLLMLHNGISLQGTPEMADVLGARFTHHPPSDTLNIKLNANHPAAIGISDFSVNDEPYQFEIFGRVNVFATYEFNGMALPAAWESSYGSGRLIYLMPGHDETAFKCGEYRRLIRSCVDYLS